MEMILENLPMALCVLLGMGLILVEVFLPGFGLPGISGIALVGVGTIMAAMHFGTLTAVALLLVPSRVLACLLSRLVPLHDEDPAPETLQKKLLPRALVYLSLIHI